ncbi:MAG: hypothetical protein KDK41_06300 [Leptospiraceae bacterium]|nr:hypothetical protein [Leptospiraceae bacterium]
MPSFLVNWSNAHHPAAGASLKYVSTSESILPWLYSSGEIMYYYSPDSNVHSLEVTGLSFANFLSPGFAIQREDNRTKTLLLAELDLFYFPFALISIIIFEKPAIIPSVYFRYKTDFRESQGSVGFRFSFPIYQRE